MQNILPAWFPQIPSDVPIHEKVPLLHKSDLCYTVYRMKIHLNPWKVAFLKSLSSEPSGQKKEASGNSPGAQPIEKRYFLTPILGYYLQMHAS